MHPFSILTLGIFVAGYITARWDLIAQLFAVTIFAWDHGVVVSKHATALGYLIDHRQPGKGGKRLRHLDRHFRSHNFAHRASRVPRERPGE